MSTLGRSSPARRRPRFSDCPSPSPEEILSTLPVKPRTYNSLRRYVAGRRWRGNLELRATAADPGLRHPGAGRRAAGPGCPQWPAPHRSSEVTIASSTTSWTSCCRPARPAARSCRRPCCSGRCCWWPSRLPASEEQVMRRLAGGRAVAGLGRSGTDRAGGPLHRRAGGLRGAPARGADPGGAARAAAAGVPGLRAGGAVGGQLRAGPAAADRFSGPHRRSGLRARGADRQGQLRLAGPAGGLVLVRQPAARSWCAPSRTSCRSPARSPCASWPTCLFRRWAPDNAPSGRTLRALCSADRQRSKSGWQPGAA